MSDCAAEVEAVSGEALAAFVAGLDPAWNVLVGVSAVDRGDFRRVLPGDVRVVVVELGERPLTDVAAGVFAVPGRCVVLARLHDAGWDVLATAGSWDPTSPGRAEVEPPGRPHRPRDDPRGGVWLGAGGTFGLPVGLSPFVTAKSGLVVAEVGAMALVGATAYGRIGVTVPLPEQVSERATSTVGALAGAVGLTLFRAAAGVDAGIALDRIAVRGGRVARLTRVEAGVRVWTPSSGGADYAGVWPSVRVGYGALVAP